MVTPCRNRVFCWIVADRALFQVAFAAEALEQCCRTHHAGDRYRAAWTGIWEGRIKSSLDEVTACAVTVVRGKVSHMKAPASGYLATIGRQLSGSNLQVLCAVASVGVWGEVDTATWHLPRKLSN